MRGHLAGRPVSNHGTARLLFGSRMQSWLTYDLVAGDLEFGVLFLAAIWIAVITASASGLPVVQLFVWTVIGFQDMRLRFWGSPNHRYAHFQCVHEPCAHTVGRAGAPTLFDLAAVKQW